MYIKVESPPDTTTPATTNPTESQAAEASSGMGHDENAPIRTDVGESHILPSAEEAAHQQSSSSGSSTSPSGKNILYSNTTILRN